MKHAMIRANGATFHIVEAGRGAPFGPADHAADMLAPLDALGIERADYGASALNSFARPGERFPFATNGIYEWFTVAVWNLADCGPAFGGLWCIPGSHSR